MQNEFESIEQSIGHIKIQEKLGSSSLGDCYKIEHDEYGICVLKHISQKVTKNKKFISRFFKDLHKFRNLQVEKQLFHENVAKIFDIANYEDDNLYIIREYVPGEELQQTIYSKKKIGILESEKMLLQIISGVGFLHSYEFVFRNLKPNNIIIDDNYNVKLVDFSLPPTQAQYLSPEQCKGKKSGYHSDVYTIGNIFFYYLTGRSVFVGATSKEIMEAHVSQEIPDVKKYRPDLSDAMVGVLAKMLAKSSEERYQNCYQLFFDAQDAAKDKTSSYEAPKKTEVSRVIKKQPIESSWKTTSQDTLETSTIQLIRSGNSWIRPDQNIETSTIELIRDGAGWKMPGSKPAESSSSANEQPQESTLESKDVATTGLGTNIPSVDFGASATETQSSGLSTNIPSVDFGASANETQSSDLSTNIPSVDFGASETQSSDLSTNIPSVDFGASANETQSSDMSFQSFSLSTDNASEEESRSNSMGYLLGRSSSDTVDETNSQDPNNSLDDLFFNPSTPSKTTTARMNIEQFRDAEEQQDVFAESYTISPDDEDLEDVGAPLSVSTASSEDVSASGEITIELPGDASIFDEDAVEYAAVEASTEEFDEGGDSLFEIYLNQGKVDTDDILNTSDGELEAVQDDSMIDEALGGTPEKTVTSEDFTTVFISKEESEQQEENQFEDSVEVELDQSFFQVPSIEINPEDPTPSTKQLISPLVANDFNTNFSEDKFTSNMYEVSQDDSQWLESGTVIDDEQDSQFCPASILFLRVKNKEAQENDLMQMINFFNEITENIEVCVERYNGNFDALMGSYLLSVFNKNGGTEDAWSAIQTSLEVKNDFAKLYPEVNIYSGIHYGEIVKACVGSAKTKRLTSIGDNVDLANELVRLCEYYQCRILLTEDVYSDHKNKVIAREIDYTLVNGRAVRIYELICLASDFLDEDIIKAHDSYSKARRMYNEGKFAQALEKFIGISCILPNDRPTAFHVERCIQFIERPPQNWDGVWRPKT
ncbi:protein kinase domain-containing protein [Candidatus Uabimicrobium amorphum]|uniref:Serine/threonine protein kinase n=1 Tax=Uabimicrobium amorphum TaxID=2596890 RepID=A0A5S9F1B9_UABAM|nr:protein kinase [Candidatus Uabimicrobium amorphum]BBM82232.1 serine/threonine protein kinase [Candidatus Uabimicrobium amorphum]